MASPKGATRRQVILGSAAAMASLYFPGIHPIRSLAAVALGKKAPKLREVLHVIRPSNPRFDALINKHYPGLATMPEFTAARPLMLMVRNKGKQPVMALSATWSIKPNSGPATLHSYSSFFTPLRLSRAHQSGERPVMNRSKLCLMSPFFCLTPARYRRIRTQKVGDSPAIVALLRQSFSRNRLTRIAAGAATVKGRLDSAIISPRLLIGRDKTGLAPAFSITRNAQHDEALTVLSAFNGHSKESLRATLVEHRNTPRKGHASPEERLYHRERIRYAGLLQRALRRVDDGSFRQLLESVKNSPPTLLTRKV
jgi:hypothetical protein